MFRQTADLLDYYHNNNKHVVELLFRPALQASWNLKIVCATADYIFKHRTKCAISQTNTNFATNVDCRCSIYHYERKGYQLSRCSRTYRILLICQKLELKSGGTSARLILRDGFHRSRRASTVHGWGNVAPSSRAFWHQVSRGGQLQQWVNANAFSHLCQQFQSFVHFFFHQLWLTNTGLTGRCILSILLPCSPPRVVWILQHSSISLPPLLIPAFTKVATGLLNSRLRYYS